VLWERQVFLIVGCAGLIDQIYPDQAEPAQAAVSSANIASRSFSPVVREASICNLYVSMSLVNSATFLIVADCV
jgi:hypothetical protein